MASARQLSRLEVGHEVEGPAGVQLAEETVELPADRVGLAGQQERRRVLFLIAHQGLLEGPQEVEERHLAEVHLLFLFLGAGGKRLRPAGPDAHPHAVHLGEGLGRLLEAPVLQQTLDQLLARILLGLALAAMDGRGSSILDFRWISRAAS